MLLLDKFDFVGLHKYTYNDEVAFVCYVNADYSQSANEQSYAMAICTAVLKSIAVLIAKEALTSDSTL